MFTTTVTPRFGEIDGLGHVNNVVLAEWFELGRNPLFRIFDPELRLSHATWPLIMAHADYDFVGELFFQPEVEITSCISRVGTKSFTVYHEAWQNGRLCATGSAVIVHYDFINRKSTPIPDDKKRLLEEHFQIAMSK
ncbi:MAG: acyl-CoA thioesterase [Treponema sp.]|jgi:acyl-CoA thioester hydrolase|nr:acyl-CoA thioesterase [Treponema sp.]